MGALRSRFKFLRKRFRYPRLDQVIAPGPINCAYKGGTACFLLSLPALAVHPSMTCLHLLCLQVFTCNYNCGPRSGFSYKSHSGPSSLFLNLQSDFYLRILISNFILNTFNLASACPTPLNTNSW